MKLLGECGDLLAQYELAFVVKAYQMERVFADIDAIDISSSKSLFTMLLLLTAGEIVSA